MRTTVMVIVMASVLSVARAETKNTEITPERISFYEVPLVCPAAAEIGCGSRAKPILLQLEQEKPVAEAWLNRPGTIVAVVWRPETKRRERTATVKSVAKKEEFKARELNGAARKKALKEFAAREAWHRGSDVDRLSEEEAGIIAARFVRRIQARVSVSEDKAKAIEAGFTDVFKRRFTGNENSDESETEEQLIRILQSHLNETDVAMLKETLPRNLRPLPGEK